MTPWEDLLREPQARAIKLIKENIKAGKPLMVLGLPGCGKYEMALRATQELGFHPYTYHIIGDLHNPGIEYGFSTCFDKFIKTVPDNGVLIFDGIDSANSHWMERFIAAIKHPDRPVIFVGIGRKNPSMILVSHCKVLTFTNDFPAELLETN